MQFTSAASALAGFLAFNSLVAALPSPFPANAGTGTGYSNRCGALENQTGKGNGVYHPIEDDCDKLRDKYRNGPEYLVLGGTQPTTAGDRFGTCAFRVTGPSDRVVQFGKNDAVDLIESTIRFVLQGTYNKATGSVRFYDSGSGDVPCQDQKGIEGVDFVKVSYEVYRP